MGATAERLGPVPRAERSLEFLILRAIGDPGVAPCPVCGGRVDEVAGGVACTTCGCEILRGWEVPSAPSHVVPLRPQDGIRV